MGVADKFWKKAIRLISSSVDIAILTIILLILTIGCYAMWDSEQVSSAASAARYEIYKPTEENQGLTFLELQAINPDVFAWLTVYGTNIDYPVVQGRDNQQYINTNAEGRYSLSGAIFLDSAASRDFTDFSSIIYGHHMEKQAMFGEIGTFAQKSFFDARQYGSLYYGGREYGLEFFYFIHTDAYDNTIYKRRITQREDKDAYLKRLSEAAINTRALDVTADDRIVLLSTCSNTSTNGRDILVGRISDELFENPFDTGDMDLGNTAAVDRITGIWGKTPLWLKVTVITVPAVLLPAILPGIINDRKRKSRKQSTG